MDRTLHVKTFFNSYDLCEWVNEHNYTVQSIVMDMNGDYILFYWEIV